ncbi:MAG: shikimate kinase [Culturomica sp.]|jgi:shikimate kinase|nr:shikimate kinase [Culturomica sp.]
MKIFLVGYMGAGKTYYGMQLARKGHVFYDLDKLIEKRCGGKSVKEVFNLFGEEYFRKLETLELKRLAAVEGDYVLATGGGTPCHSDNMILMNEVGHTIFLDTDVNLIVKRLTTDKSDRPLIANMDDDELTDFVTKQRKERLPFYQMAKETLEMNANNEYLIL